MAMDVYYSAIAATGVHARNFPERRFTSSPITDSEIYVLWMVNV